MRTTTSRRLGGVVALAAAATLGLTACSSGSGSSSEDAMSSSSMTTTQAPAMQSSAMAPSAMASSGAMAAAANLVGSGCAAYAEQNPSGPGSVAGMAMDPVVTAASNNPMLTTLTKALSGKVNPEVNLVDTLNGGQFTVFAPTDDAFAKIDADTMKMLTTNADALTNILTYHVIPGQLSPDQIAGTHKTVEGAEVTVTGSGDDLMVDGASVVCGGVKTANATVYLIDSVLMPPKS